MRRFYVFPKFSLDVGWFFRMLGGSFEDVRQQGRGERGRGPVRRFGGACPAPTIPHLSFLGVSRLEK